MTIYAPCTMVGRAALAVWHQVGKEMTPLEDAEYILGRVRAPDMELARRVAKDVGVHPSIVDLCWTRMMDAILAQVPEEERALAEFEKEHAP